MADRQAAWQLEGSAAERYQRLLVVPVTSVWAADLVEAAAIRAGDHVLDVACGTGVVARAAAARAGPGGSVVGLDLNEDMLRVARSIDAPTASPVEWILGSALDLPFGDDAFDTVTCQLGLQFVPDPGLALREAHRVLRRGGTLALSVYAELERNPATNALVAALDARLGPDASRAKRAEHALADGPAIAHDVRAAGFADVELETVTKHIRFPAVSEYVTAQLTATPLATLLEGIEPDRHARLVADIEGDLSTALADFRTPEGLVFPQVVHRVVALA